MMRRFLSSPFFKILLLAVLMLLPQDVLAQSLNLNMGEQGGDETGRVLQLIALITILSLAPSILVMVTSFTRIVVVLSFIRTAIGLQQTPPNGVIISLALFLTAFIMTPTFQQAYDKGIAPLIAEDISEKQAFAEVLKPFHGFMMEHVREQDLKLFVSMAQQQKKDLKIESPEDVPIQALIPAFMISELRRAFEIGFLLFLPFLIIDMVIASVLMSMGMMMLPPVMISLPFKIIFFVMIDGWYMLAGSLVQGYGLKVLPAVGGG